jgi:uncharacterized protein YktA (UPF0223 family)
MYKVFCGSMMAVVLMLQCGCGQSADTLMQQQVDQLNELADAMESGAETAKIEEINKRMKETAEALKGLNISDAEEKRLGEKFNTEVTEATARVAKANMSQMQERMKGMMPDMPDMPDMSKGMPKLP